MKLRTEKGFTIIEIVIALAIIAILASMVAPLAVNHIQSKRFDACREELEIIKKAIVGDPALVEGGTRSSFGFVGDLGVLPANLGELTQNTAGTFPVWQLGPNTMWYFGWRGPYLSEANDPWGNPYTYVLNPAAYISARISSGGPDGITAGLTIDIRFDEVFSVVSGNILDPCGASAPCSLTQQSSVIIYYPEGTAGLQTRTAQINAEIPIYNTMTTTTFLPTPYFTVPIGIREITGTIAFTNGSISQTKTTNRLIYINNGPITTETLKAAGTCY